MSRRFESNKNVCALPCTEPDAQIIYHATHYILYQQIRLNDLYKQYLETALLSKKVFRTGLQKSLLKKSYELASGLQFYARIFEAAQRQFDWLEISLVLVTTIFDSYNAELVSTVLDKVKAENITNIYNVANDLEFVLTDKDQKHQTYKQFVVYNYNDCSIAPLTA